MVLRISERSAQVVELLEILVDSENVSTVKSRDVNAKQLTSSWIERGSWRIIIHAHTVDGTNGVKTRS